MISFTLKQLMFPITLHFFLSSLISRCLLLRLLQQPILATSCFAMPAVTFPSPPAMSHLNLAGSGAATQCIEIWSGAQRGRNKQGAGW